MTIDAHQHFWRYTAEDYGWIDDNMAVIRRDFGPDDLAAVFRAHGVDGSITVQARQTLAETDWLLDLAGRPSPIAGVVGWAPLVEPEVRRHLERFSAAPKFKGVRHVVQGEPAGFLDRPDFNRGIREVTSCGLTYDVLIFARQLEEATRFVDRHPRQVFILDHIAKPVVSGAPDPLWVRQIREFARRENTYCKFSGVATEVPGWKWTAALVKPYFDVALEAFGAKRLMYGSDWPVCLVAAAYAEWIGFVRECASNLSLDEQAWIFGKTAASAYRLP